MISAILIAGSLAAPPDPTAIVGGDVVPTCGWPTTLSSGGCTATLVHPKAISTAQHCGAPSQVSFGESFGGGRVVGVLDCVGTGSQDAMLCELAEEVTEVPVTPVLYGCEADTYLQVGQPVVIVGFGMTSYGGPSGTKYWAPQQITAVEAGRVIVGNPGDGVSPCPGDSGGPVFVQVEDGSWRVFGTVLGGTTGTPCNSAADFQRIDAVVPAFEQQTGLDITPCFDGATGAWDAGPDCGSFFAGDHNGVGTWADMCSGTPASSWSDACGAPYGDLGGSSSGSTGDPDPSAGDDDPFPSTTGSDGGDDDDGDDDANDGDDGDDDDDDDGGPVGLTAPPYSASDNGGCGCRRTDVPAGPGLLALVLLLLATRTRP